MAAFVPKIKAIKPNAMQIKFLYKIQLNRPYPDSQHVTSSIQTGKIRPRLEKPKAPISVMSGPIEGKIMANVTAETARNVLQKNGNINQALKKKRQIKHVPERLNI